MGFTNSISPVPYFLYFLHQENAIFQLNIAQTLTPTDVDTYQAL